MDKIAYLANSRIPSREANTVHVLNMSAAFAAQGCAVTLIARGEPAAAASVFADFGLPAAFDLRLVPHRRPWAVDRLRFVRHVRRVLGGGGFDFVYGRSCYGLLAGVPGSIPLAFDLHAFPAAPRHVRLEALLFRRPNFLFATAITQALADKYSAVYPHLRGRILVAPCAAKLPDEGALASGAREPGRLRVYYVGHLYAGRGIDMILELARTEPEIEFHIVGGDESDVAFWAAHAPANVSLHGYVKPARLAAYYRRADICIAPHGRKVAAAGGGDISPWMSPMKVFEYMAHAKPIVAADLPVLREIVEPGVDGLLCPPGDIAAWREAIRCLGLDAGMRARLGAAARRKLERDHTWERRAGRIIARAESLLGRALPGDDAPSPALP